MTDEVEYVEYQEFGTRKYKVFAMYNGYALGPVFDNISYAKGFERHLAKLGYYQVWALPYEQLKGFYEEFIGRK